MTLRCACGRSARFPVCDGSHRASSGGPAAWECASHPPSTATWYFAASRANANVAERLAFELGGVAAHRVAPHRAAAPLVADRVVAIVEGHDLAEVRALVDQVEARARYVWALGAPALAAAAQLSGFEVVALDGEHALWTELRRAARGELALTRPRRLARAFVSHAVRDEGDLLPAVARLRAEHGADLFVCADSILPGTEWESTILRELVSRPVFVSVVSAASTASTYCAFEAGAARALGKEITLVSLDGTRPPAFLQHLHAIDLARRLEARPWLPRSLVLLDALLEAASLEAPVVAE